jgi:hypothetical protein
VGNASTSVHAGQYHIHAPRNRFLIGIAGAACSTAKQPFSFVEIMERSNIYRPGVILSVPCECIFPEAGYGDPESQLFWRPSPSLVGLIYSPLQLIVASMTSVVYYDSPSCGLIRRRSVGAISALHSTSSGLGSPMSDGGHDLGRTSGSRQEACVARNIPAHRQLGGQ